jgi:molecular chaperone DnaK
VPQIEVKFDIDANGILNVSAKDKATGKEQSIVIKASSGLSDDEIDRMVKDAEAHADDDRKFHELVAARNQADTMIHATRKSLEQLGDDKLEAGEKDKIESAIKDLEEAMKGEDKDRIESLTKALGDASGKMAERLYAQGRPAPVPARRPGPAAAAAAAESAAPPTTSSMPSSKRSRTTRSNLGDGPRAADKPGSLRRPGRQCPRPLR